MSETQSNFANRNIVVNYLNSLAIIIISGTLLILPLFFLTTATDFYIFPKQALIVFATLALFLLWGIRTVVEKKVTFLLSPLNIPVAIFGVVVALSIIFSPNSLDSLIQGVPVIMLSLLFFLIINFIQNKSSYSIAVSSLLIGGALSAIITIFYQFRVFVLPFPEIQNQLFSTVGSSIQQVAFLTPLFVLAGVMVIHELRIKKISALVKNYGQLLQLIAALIFLGGITTIFYQIVTATQAPIILPMNHGFQVALSSLSQDTARLATSFLLGSGYGTFSTVFNLFHLASFNTLPTWNISFAFSSSYFLELISTTGILGAVSLLFLLIKFVRTRSEFFNPIFLATLSVFVISFAIPFTISLIFLLFVLLALFTVYLNLNHSKKIQKVILNVVALQQGLLSVKDDEHARRSGTGMILPIIVLFVSAATLFVVSFSLVKQGDSPRRGFVNLVLSDTKFARSLEADSLRQGSQTYQMQLEAINQYPYRSDYYRIFSQINVAIASSLVNTQAGEATPDPLVQQQILQLLQQAINSGRTSINISPRNSFNWNNLAQIYRSLIGVGQNAEQFAVASMNQAIVLNPNNPALRVSLGGIYFQLQQFDLAQNAFQIAVNLKPDFANAHYNLGHSLEENNDLVNALRQYQIVQQLVANDQNNLNQITSEIEAIKARLAESERAQLGELADTPSEDLEPSEDTNLELSTPTDEFPPRDPQVDIPEPPNEQGSTEEEASGEEPSPTP